MTTPDKPAPAPTDLKHAPLPHTATEGMLGSALAVGVLASAAIAAVGAVFLLRSHGHETADFTTYTAQPEGLRRPLTILKDAAHFRSAAVIQLGVLVLVLTPVVRVAFSLVLFALRRDVMYAVVCFVVLAVLLAGLLGGVA